LIAKLFEIIVFQEMFIGYLDFIAAASRWRGVVVQQN